MKQLKKTNVMKAQTTLQDTVPANRNWEVTIWIFALLVTALLFASTNGLALTPQFEDEEYIDDIPFDTEWVVNELRADSIDFDEEAYVDDIPFNTATIAANYNYNNALTVSFEMEEEAYIDDIPFNTYLIAQNSKSIGLELMASGN